MLNGSPAAVQLWSTSLPVGEAACQCAHICPLCVGLCWFKSPARSVQWPCNTSLVNQYCTEMECGKMQNIYICDLMNYVQNQSVLYKPVCMVMLNLEANRNSSNDSLFLDVSNSLFDDTWTSSSNIYIFIFWYSGVFLELKLCLHVLCSQQAKNFNNFSMLASVIQGSPSVSLLLSFHYCWA